MIIPESNIEPVIKWSGSKRKIAPILSKLIPNTNRYIEPFVGGGSMLPYRKIENGIASDIIIELISLWNEIKTNPTEIKHEYKKRWGKLQEEGSDYYYEIRNQFNSNRDLHDFLFLTRTCVNGLIRYNNNGDFNNSFHLTRPGINPYSFNKIVDKWNYYIRNIDFFVYDYKEVFEQVKNGNFLFLDPPYAGNKDRYLKNCFNVNEFYENLDKLNTIGAKWMLTFDGNAGYRVYDYEIPRELYISKIIINTGNSPFTKMMKTTIDAVLETVYFNFQIDSARIDNIIQNSNDKITIF